MRRINFSLLLLLNVVLFVELVRAESDPILSDKDTAQRVWTVEDLLAEGKLPKKSRKPKYCNGQRFTPCICTKSLSADIQYRPSVKECNGAAAAILSGKYQKIFSVVLRDGENRDRYPTPPTNFNGCSSSQSLRGESRCSAFKTQDSFTIGRGREKRTVYCFGASGYSKLLENVVRITAKLRDVPGSNKDPLERWCLDSPTLPLN